MLFSPVVCFDVSLIPLDVFNKCYWLHLQAENAEGQKTKVMYCKEKIYAGTEEFSFEELRAARIFAKIREGKYLPPQDIEIRTESNVRYMYPKKEVYSFDGEFQYEEILARRYYARLKTQGASKKQPQVSQVVQPASGLLVNSRGFPSNDEPCPMEIGSCQKNVAMATAGKPSYEDGNLCSASTGNSR